VHRHETSPVDRMDSLLVVAGEASGDEYGAALIHRLHDSYPHLHSYGVGGAQMRAMGVETLFDINLLNTIGFVEACARIPQGLRIMRHLCRETGRRHTRVAVLIDAPAFNLPLARRLKKAGLRVVYYVSPQFWAWRQGRVKKIARRVDKMLTLFPFEVPFYTAAGVDAEYVGHPLIDRLQHLPSSQQAAKSFGLDSQRPIVALLPGSRAQEIQRLLPPMLDALQCIKQRLPQVQALLPLAATVSVHEIKPLLERLSLDLTVVSGQSSMVLRAADFAIIASGTATLEAGYIGTPMVLVYKVHPLTACLARHLIRIPYIGLVNIVAGKQVVTELVQQQVQPQTIAAYALACLEHPEAAQCFRDQLGEIPRLLGTGDSSHRAAACVGHFLRLECEGTMMSRSEAR
jgi:lipid-A-disaccharide synthase